MRDISFRMAQKFMPGFLVDRWYRTETDPRKSSKIARKPLFEPFGAIQPELSRCRENILRFLARDERRS